MSCGSQERPGRPQRAVRGAPRRGILIALATVLGALGLALLAAALDDGSGTAGTDRSPYGSYAPGIAAPVSAIDRIPPSARAPEEVRIQARRLTARTGGDPELAIRTLRLVRRDLGLDRASIYAFKADGKAVCILMTERGVTCPTPSRRSPAGVLWFIAGGIPAWASEGGLTIPSAAVGLVADNVRRVAYAEAGKRWTIPIRNNVFFKELPNPEPKGFLEFQFFSGRQARMAVAPARPT